MTDIDIRKIKPGDYVTVRAKVTAIQEEPVEFCIAPNVIRGSTMWVSSSAIVGHEPAPEPLKIGDAVTVDYEFGASRFTVVHLQGVNVWVHNAEKTMDALFHVSRLRRVEQP